MIRQVLFEFLGTRDYLIPQLLYQTQSGLLNVIV